MFPENNLREQIENLQNNEVEQTRELAKTTSLNFENDSVIMTNGNPEMITDLEAIRQWIVLFCVTPRDTLEIYQGTDFGTSWRKLLGEKFINNGYATSELEREITEGLPLNPAIESVESVEITKNGRYLSLNIQVELYDGNLVKFELDKIYTIKY